MQPRRLLVALAAALLAAGCAAPAAPPDVPLLPGEVPQEALGPGFFAFAHAGGPLTVAVEGGAAELQLFGADDERIGGFRLGGGVDAFTLDAAPAGRPVLHVLELNGTLRVHSAGVPLTAFQPLHAHMERHVLLQGSWAPPWRLPGSPITPPSQPYSQSFDVELLRAPTSLRLLASGSFAELQVLVRGTQGPVLAAEHDGNDLLVGMPVLGPHPAPEELPAEFFRENVRDGRLNGTATFEAFEGALVLEATAYSRAQPAATLRPFLLREPAGGTYGELFDVPARFRLPEGSTYVAFRNANEGADDAPAAVALHALGGERLAAVTLPAGEVWAVPVAASELVAVRLAGRVELLAPLPPLDQELHPLEVTSTSHPQSVSWSEHYQSQDEQVVARGALFGFSVEQDGDWLPPWSACDWSATFAVRQGGETLAWGEGEQFPVAMASMLLSDGEVRLWHDSSGGPPCARVVAHAFLVP